MRPVLLGFAIAYTLIGARTSHAQTATRDSLPRPPEFQARRAPSAVAIDGRLDDASWQNATRVTLDWEWFPGDNTAPPVATECFITYDLDNFYLGCRAHDPEPSRIRAHYADRDDVRRLPGDDHFILMIDPFNDQRRSFQFRVNPVGVQLDAVFFEAESIEDISWDAIWKSAGRITETGYEIEIALPFRSLRFPKTRGPQTWGFLVERSWPRANRHRIQSAPRDRDNACLNCQLNKLHGLEGISPGNNLEFTPTLTSGRTDTRDPFPAGPMNNGDVDVDPGLDVRWGITPNLSLNATANPDFSQVEADVAQLEVNTRFALFFPEKRPFFLEGADFFSTPIQAVFTRTVADPVGGLKLSGKAGSNGFGVFTTYDRLNNLIFPANQVSGGTSLSDSVVTTVARYRRDVGAASAVGFLFTGRESGAYHNRVAGADAFLRIGAPNTLRVQLLGSETRYPDSVATNFGQPAGTFAGTGFDVQFQHFSRDWFGSLQYTDLSPDFRTDAGFVPRVDQRSVFGQLSRVSWGGSGSWFNQILSGVYGGATVDYDGSLTDAQVGLSAFYQGPQQSQVFLNLQRVRERFLDIEHDQTQVFGGGSVRPTGSLQLGLNGQVGDAVDFANNRKAFGLTLVPDVRINIGRPITVGVNHTFQRLSFDGTRIFTANLLQVRTLYHFNVRTFVRAIVQYQDIDQNPAAFSFPIEDSRRLFTQFLFSYKLNPQTVVFAGYSDTRVGAESFDLTQRGRTFFVKLGYALRP